MEQFKSVEITPKLEVLKRVIRSAGKIAIAFSGGIDSSLVAKVAYDELKDNALAITLDSDVFPRRDLLASKKTAGEIGIEHIIVKQLKLDDSTFACNSKERCYLCKKGEIGLIKKTALARAIDNIAYGVNESDQNEHRPGIRALIEAGVLFPLKEAGIGKSLIPHIAKLTGLSNWNMPSTTCLASRIPYGTIIDPDKLARIEQAEEYLLGIRVRDSRVRYHGDIARIEVPHDEIDRIISGKEAIVEEFRRLGFTYITLDLQGYRSGSMDEIL